MPDSPVSPIVMASGQMIGFKFFEGDGTTPSDVDSMASPSEAQKIVFSGAPAGGNYSLTFNGQTTAPIATTQGPPEVYAEWSVTLASTGAWDIAINTVFGSPWSPAATYEVFDGAATTPLVTTALNTISGAGNPTPFTDGTLAGNGSAIQWYPIGTNLTFTGTTCRVRLSGPGVASDSAANGLQTDYVRAAPHGGGTAILKSSAGITLVSAINGAHSWSQNSDSRCVGPTPFGYFASGLGAGPQTETDPAAVQAALTGLSTVGAGNLTATGIGNPFSPVALDFAGTLALSAQNLITCADAAVQVTRVNAGGLWPSYRINGGAPVKLDNPLYYTGNYDSNGNARAHSAYMPVVAFPLFQAHPAVSYEENRAWDNTLSGSWNTPDEQGISLSVSGNYSPYYRITTGSDGSATARWPRPALKAGTYRISFTRPSDPSFSADTVWTVTDRAGTVLASVHDNQTVALTGNLDQGVSWVILGSFTVAPAAPAISDDLIVTLSNATSTRMVADTVRFERTSADDSVTIQPSDTVTVSYGAAFATSVYGPCAAATDAPATNLAGQAIYPALPTSVTMPLGWNLPDQQPFSGSFWYTNLVRSINGINADTDGDGYPTATRGGATSVSAVVAQPQEQKNGDGKMIPSLPPGDYTLMWDGQSDMSIDAAAEQAGLASVNLAAGATDNKRVYTIGAAFRSYGIALSVRWHVIPGGTTIDARNIRIYRNAEVPDVGNAPKFMPSLMAQRVAGAKSMRFLDPSGAINGNATDFADFNPPQSRLTRTSPTRALAPVITRIEAYTGSILFDPGTVPVLITTAAPHGLAEGQYTDFIEGFSGVVNLSGGGTIDLQFQTFGFIYYDSPTTFAFRLVPPGGATNQTMTNVLTGANLGIVHVNIGNGMPLQDLVDFCNQIGSDIWIQTTVCATDACISAIGDFLGANLNPGLKVRFEYTNEPWNTTSKPFSWIAPQGYRLGYSGVASNYIPFYVREANRHAGLIRTAMAAHGRGGDLSLMLNTRFFTFGDTGDVCQLCRDNGLSFDMLAFSLYFDNGPSFHPPVNNPVEPPLFPVYDMLTAGQVIDEYEMMVTFTGWGADEFAPHRAILRSSGESSPGAGDGPFANTPIGAYEGGPERDLPLGPAGFASVNAARRAHQIKYHPRNRGLILHTIRTYADGGCHILHLFHVGGGDGGSGDNNYSGWSAYVGTGMPPYAPGDATQDAVQTGQYNRLDLVQSMTGGAHNTWQSLYAAGQTPATSYTATVAPASVAAGSPATATVTPDGTYSGTITGTPSGTASSGLSPVTLTFSGSAAAQTASWTPTAPGTLTVAWTNSGTLTNPSNGAVTVTAAAVPSATLGAASIAAGATGTATASGFTGGQVTWSTSDPSVATIDASTGVYTGVDAGTCQFTATGVGDNSQVATTAALTVTPPPPPAPTVELGLSAIMRLLTA